MFSRDKNQWPIIHDNTDRVKRSFVYPWWSIRNHVMAVFLFNGRAVNAQSPPPCTRTRESLVFFAEACLQKRATATWTKRDFFSAPCNTKAYAAKLVDNPVETLDKPLGRSVMSLSHSHPKPINSFIHKATHIFFFCKSLLFK